jgi:formate-dependent nitrite reductase membrane component NrfD
MPTRDPTLEAERARDGRNVAPQIGALLGEGAGQRVRDVVTQDGAHLRERDGALPPALWETGTATEAGPGPSYHGMPVLKEPVWKWMIPAYFFTGGLAGACAVLGAAAQAAGGRGAEALVRRCRLVAAAGAAASAGLLVADLGRPSRFLAMLRVFRPTSPMNMGTWILTPFGAFSGLAAVATLLPRPPRALEAGARAATVGAGVLGLPLVGYTGVLVSNTAVPVWQATRNTLPILFAFSGAVSAGSLFEVWPPGGAGEAMARRLGVLSKAAELALSFALDAEASRAAPRVARPLRRGLSGAILETARVLVAASLAGALWAPRRRGRTVGRLAGTLGLAGTLLLRFGIMAAGRASARDPHASFEMQRRGHGAVELARKKPDASGRMPSVPGVDATGKESFDAGPGL